ncbi:hypothetical protein EXIGLDRAFT_734620 [Exidia glandulosa HHB12029]|uniref:Uncharacterized protein n=1 Tax=Exidia glandulosa HHB12029 TaxID=1314781 RepID=A0A165PQ33_EXIGL|nr:hypothetical protein EXIGLDRAFT_734620 [Exidia glandulosa HHB12029]
MSQASTSSSRHVVPATTAAGMWQAHKDATVTVDSKIERKTWTQMWREQLEPVTVDSVVDDSSSRSASPTLASSPPTSVAHEHEHEHEDRPPSRLVRTESGWWLRRDSDSAPSPVAPKRRDDTDLRTRGWVFGPARQTPVPEDSEDEDDRLHRLARTRRSSPSPLPPPRPRTSARPTWSSVLFLPSHVERMVGHRPAVQWASWND